MCKGSGRQAGSKEEPPGGYLLPVCGGWCEQNQQSSAAETDEMRESPELSCCISTVKRKAEESVALLLGGDRRPHDKECEEGQSAKLLVLLLGFFCLFSQIRPALGSLSVLAESGGIALPTGKGDGVREHFTHRHKQVCGTLGSSRVLWERIHELETALYPL